MQVRTGLLAPAMRVGGPKNGSQSRDLLWSFATAGVVSDSSKSESGVAGAALLRAPDVLGRFFLAGASSSELELRTYVCGLLEDGAILQVVSALHTK